MLKTRVIPSLLLKESGLVKTTKFKSAKYVGDPINAIKIFNDKETDELVVLDISASKKNHINYKLISRINKEAFMPLAYGGGIRSLDDISSILGLGYEKIVINSIAIEKPCFITKAAEICGSQSVVVCIDVKKDLLGKYRVFNHVNGRKERLNVREWAKEVEERGAGEIILYNVDREGTFSGYDLQLLSMVTTVVNIPVIALGGAGSIIDFQKAIKKGGASAVAAGSMFVYHGPHRAVLITYPDKNELQTLL